MCPVSAVCGGELARGIARWHVCKRTNALTACLSEFLLGFRRVFPGLFVGESKLVLQRECG